MNGKIITRFLILAGLMLCLSPAYATVTCSLDASNYSSPSKDLQGADAVFIGTPVNVSIESMEDSYQTLYRATTAKFKIIRAFKGITGNEITVTSTALNEGDWVGTQFEVGRVYLVYAYYNRCDLPKGCINGSLYTSFCDRTKELSCWVSGQGELDPPCIIVCMNKTQNDGKFSVCTQDEQKKVSPGLNEALKDIPSYGGRISSYFNGAFYAYPDYLEELQELSKYTNAFEEPNENKTSHIMPQSTNSAPTSIITVPRTSVTNEDTAKSTTQKTEKSAKVSQNTDMLWVGIALIVLTLASLLIYRMNKE